jgi:hypothetical protein
MVNKYRRPSLFVVLVFAVLNIHGRTNANIRNVTSAKIKGNLNVTQIILPNIFQTCFSLSDSLSYKQQFFYGQDCHVISNLSTFLDNKSNK